MGWRPELNVVCGRCGKPRGLTHTCPSAASRKPTIKAAVSFGTCPTCRKPQGNPLTHTCHPKSDFKRRKADSDKAQRARTRRKRQKNDHDYQACTDNDCLRPLCTAFKTGYATGLRDGYEHGWKTGWQLGHQEGYRVGFPAGIAACPRPHK